MSKMELKILKEEPRMKILNSLRLCFKKDISRQLKGFSHYPSPKILNTIFAGEVTTACDNKMFTMK